MKDLEGRLAAAVRRFWTTRDKQAERQGSVTGERDRGSRSAVTGGAQMDGFVELVKDLLIESGISDAAIFRETKLELPGYYRPTKKWDLLVVVRDQLLAAIELKSLIGSFGNNSNNRTEEALGNATDLRTAFREGAFSGSPPPWLGYLMLFEEAPKSTSPVAVHEPHFPVFPEFRGTSYVGRFELLCLKLVRERLYDAACLLLSDREGGPGGRYREPNAEIGFANFVASLSAKAIAYSKVHARGG